MSAQSTIRIAMWSGPRNISTAMMRSWENRADTTVIDEPFYACYLKRSSSPHPGFDAIMASQSSDYKHVAQTLSEGPCRRPIEYQKHMTHHMFDDIKLNWVASLRHCFLIRSPERVVASYTRARGVCQAADVGIYQQWRLFQQISDITGQEPPVVDADDVLQTPRDMLPKICAQLDVAFDPAMLAWPAGKRDSDGVWAPYWYKSVEQSTGFAGPATDEVTLNDAQRRVVDEVYPVYETMHAQRLR